MATDSTQGYTQEQLDAVGEKIAEPIKLLTKNDILGFSDLTFETVHVPEWGGTVRVRGLRGVELDAYNASMVKQRGNSVDMHLVNVRAGLCARAICDASGNRVFTDEEIGLLGQKSAAALERVYEVAARLSGISDAAMETMLGNSASDRSDAPSSV